MQGFKRSRNIYCLDIWENVRYDCSRFFLVLFLSALHDPEYCPNPEGLNLREERCKDTTSRMGIVTAHERAYTVAKSKCLSKNSIFKWFFYNTEFEFLRQKSNDFKNLIFWRISWILPQCVKLAKRCELMRVAGLDRCSRYLAHWPKWPKNVSNISVGDHGHTQTIS